MKTEHALVTVEANQLQTTSEVTLGFNPDNLPSDLKGELRKLQNEKSHYLTQLQSVETKLELWAVKVKTWYAQTTSYGPSDVLDSEELANYYPAVVLDDGPLLGDNPLAKAEERNHFEQRRLATDLLTGALSKDRKARLKERAGQLLCSLSPLNEDFFPEKTLNECLEREGLTNKKRVNEVLGRPQNSYVKTTDYRKALREVWNERNEELLLKARFDKGEWGDLEASVLEAFTVWAWFSVTGKVWDREWNPHPNTTEELRRAFFDVLEQAESRGEDRENYLLDPREEDTWVGLTAFTAALKEQPDEEWYGAWQDRETPAQRWVKEFGLKHLYGGCAEWWVEVPDKNADEVLKSNETEPPGNTYYRECYRESEVKTVVNNKYTERLNEVLASA